MYDETWRETLKLKMVRDTKIKKQQVRFKNDVKLEIPVNSQLIVT